MKKLILLSALLFSLSIVGQETDKDKVAVKTINKERKITGYLIVYVNKEHQATKTIRVNSYTELQTLNVMCKANAKIKHEDIPKDKLLEGEYFKNGVRE